MKVFSEGEIVDYKDKQVDRKPLVPLFQIYFPMSLLFRIPNNVFPSPATLPGTQSEYPP